MTAGAQGAGLRGMPPKFTLLYDGHCAFCERSSQELLRHMPQDLVARRSFRDPLLLAQFPQVSAAECERAMQLIDRDGRVWSGAAAAARLLRTRWWGWPVGALYLLPGIRQLMNWGYAIIARNRFRIAGRTCDSDACAAHQGPHS